MFHSFFQSVFDSALSSAATPAKFLLCMGTSLLIGLLLCVMMMWHSNFSKSFAITLATLPAVVCVIIMMVNGNVGTGVAVAGTFGLVRFRSAPGSAREIGSIFIAMGAGLAAGIGYLGYALVFTLVLGGITMLYNRIKWEKFQEKFQTRTLHITIPENLDYIGVFDPVLNQYTSSHTLTQVKTTNMGSLFKLTYHVTLNDPAREKFFLDELRLRNGNLELSLCHQDTDSISL